MPKNGKRTRKLSVSVELRRAFGELLELVAASTTRGHLATHAIGAPPPRSIINKKKSRRLRPRWDQKARTLYLGKTLIKDFKVPAKNQDRVLAAFEEQNWPHVIDDPLPPTDGIDAKVRLHNTLLRLNRSHYCRLIRFGGNGNGRGFTWQRVSKTSKSAARSHPMRLYIGSRRSRRDG